MGEYTGARCTVRIEGTKYTIAKLAKILKCSPSAARRRYLHRKERGMEITLRLLARPINCSPKRLVKPRPLSPLATRVRQYLQAQGRKVEDMAKMMGIQDSSASRMICRSNQLTPKRVAQIADWLMLTEEEEHELNILGARERGWKV